MKPLRSYTLLYLARSDTSWKIIQIQKAKSIITCFLFLIKFSPANWEIIYLRSWINSIYLALSSKDKANTYCIWSARSSSKMHWLIALVVVFTKGLNSIPRPYCQRFLQIKLVFKKLMKYIGCATSYNDFISHRQSLQKWSSNFSNVFFRWVNRRDICFLSW